MIKEKPDSQTSIATIRRELGEYITNRLRGVEAGEIIDSHTTGVCTKALALLEELLRNSLARGLSVCAMSYDQEIRASMGGRTLRRLTLGQLLQCFEMLNLRLTECIRSSHSVSEKTLDNHLLMSSTLNGRLSEINRRRKLLIHFGNDDEMKQLLILIKDSIADQMFEVIESL